MSTTSPAAAARDGFLQSYRQLAGELDRSAPLWLRRMRQQAIESFEETGFPSPRDEQWRQTNVEPITTTRFEPAGDGPSEVGAATIGSVPFVNLAAPDGPRLVFVEGRLVRELSELDGLPPEVVLGSLAQILRDHPETIEPHLTRQAGRSEHGFAALNTAFLADGAVILVPEAVKLERPIEIVHLASGADQPRAVHPRTLVVAGAESELTLIEIHAGAADKTYLSNGVTELVAGPAARIDHVRIQSDSHRAYHIGVVRAHQQRDSTIRSFSFNFGAALARHDVSAELAGEGAHAALFGLYVIGERQHVDSHTVLDHAAAHCTSHELYRGVLADRARSVFNGRIVVREGAQKTDAVQSNANLLLSDRALAHSRPQLEIYADDVRCTHGATIGQLDADAMFYLRARGIGTRQAREMLIHAFVAAVLDELGCEPLREGIEAAFSGRLADEDRTADE
ncbi:MAG: Fe-S cluster assembly protein SufD [Acidobacteriota bacterium]|nr:MAG: Fe-S cluster assembly protein SufD [Acidobacteriota bacterium]